MDPIAADAADAADPDDVCAGDGASGVAAFVPSDNTTLVSVLAGLAEHGYTTQFIAGDGGVLQCDRCRTASPAADFDVRSIRRLEGASEPAEMMSVVAAACPSCGASGTAVLGYGPAASPVDADVSVALAGGRSNRDV